MIKKKIINPWHSPPTTHSSHRVIHLYNLPHGTEWKSIESYFEGYIIEFSHFFSSQALIQFSSSEMARKFMNELSNRLSAAQIQSEFSCIYYLEWDNFEKMSGISRVLCIQVVKLRVPLSIFDIYDECSLFGTVEKIICFEKSGKFALAQMKTISEAGLAMINLSNSPRHSPGFQLRVQFSKNQDIAIKFNNSKSFDFTSNGAIIHFEQLRAASISEPGFFEPEKVTEVPPVFDLFRPVHFDPAFTHYLNVTNIDEMENPCDTLRNLFKQYGPVFRVKSNILKGGRSNALILMANGFYARLAAYFMQNCPLFGREMRVDLPMHLDPSAIGSSGCETTIKDYEADNPSEFVGYEEMWVPSEYVKVYPDTIKVSFMNLDSSIEPIPERNVLKFANIDQASVFIAKNGNGVIDNEHFSLRFTHP